MWRKMILLEKNPGKEKPLQILDERFNQPVIRLGDPELLLQQVDAALINGNTLEYCTPNIVSLQLSISRNATQSASAILEVLTNASSESEKHGDKFDRNVLVRDSKTVCDYLEQIQTAIVFSFTAVETFANLSIPDSYSYSKTETKRTETYDKRQMERYLHWKVKLSEILVDVYGTEVLCDQPCWGPFCELAKIRDKIIHQKSVNDTTHFETLFDKRIFRLCAAASDLIEYFVNHLPNSNRPMNGNERFWPILRGEGLTLGAANLEIRTSATDGDWNENEKHN